MDRPPRLTPKEREILPSLIAGCTRDEIASDLGIGLDAVRFHVRNILKKFDAVSVKDGTVRFQVYEALYGENGPCHKVFVDELTIKITVNNDLKTAIYEKFSEMYVVHPQLEELRECVICDGQILQVSINSQIIEASSVTHGQNWYVQSFKKRKRVGETFGRHFTCRIADAFNADTEYWAQEQIIPTGFFRFSISLPENRPAKRFWCECSLQNQPFEMELSEVTSNGRFATLEVPNPLMNAWYKIFWDW